MVSCAWVLEDLVCFLLEHRRRSPTAYLVNERSIFSLKRRALKRTRTLRRDLETHQIIRPSPMQEKWEKIKAIFTRDFWDDLLERSDDETLVDGKLLSYSYLEAGVIEMLGSSVFFIASELQFYLTSPLRSRSLVAYFVVFFKHGFSPIDLRRAQQAPSSNRQCENYFCLQLA